MEVVVGVDLTSETNVIVDWLQRLNFQPPPTIHLVLVTENLHLIASETFPFQPLDVAEVDFLTQEREGQKRLSDLAALLERRGMSCDFEIRHGHVIQELLAAAEERKAQLIAVGAGRLNPLTTTHVGHVTKKLVINAKQSLFIAKNPPRFDVPLQAVLATDQSPYSNRMTLRLLNWNPRGMSGLAVFTASQPELLKRMRYVLGQDEKTLRHWAQERLLAQNKALGMQLGALGCECEPLVKEGNPDELLPRVMEQRNAELLIMGAEGHGFWDRMAIGSVSFHQAVSTPYSVLILRG